MITTASPRFIRVTGRSGSGKTTWALKHARKLSGNHRLYVLDCRSGYKDLLQSQTNFKAETFLMDVSEGLSGEAIERIMGSGHVDENSTLIIDEFSYVVNTVGEKRLRRIIGDFIAWNGSIVVTDQSEDRPFFKEMDAHLASLSVAKQHVQL